MTEGDDVIVGKRLILGIDSVVELDDGLLEPVSWVEQARVLPDRRSAGNVLDDRLERKVGTPIGEVGRVADPLSKYGADPVLRQLARSRLKEVQPELCGTRHDLMSLVSEARQCWDELHEA